MQADLPQICYSLHKLNGGGGKDSRKLFHKNLDVFRPNSTNFSLWVFNVWHMSSPYINHKMSYDVVNGLAHFVSTIILGQWNDKSVHNIIGHLLRRKLSHIENLKVVIEFSFDTESLYMLNIYVSCVGMCELGFAPSCTLFSAMEKFSKKVFCWVPLGQIQLILYK